jgi:squalene cyclase
MTSTSISRKRGQATIRSAVSGLDNVAADAWRRVPLRDTMTGRAPVHSIAFVDVLIPMHSHRLTSRLAQAYILGHCVDGLWSDFLTRAGESDEWTTAFVSLCLLRGGTSPCDLRASAARLLRRQRPCGGWGYNQAVPADADSTACCARAIRAIAPNTTHELTAARAYLSSHQRAAGFATYCDSASLRNYLGLDSSASLSGWCGQAHNCVTASIALAYGGAQTHSVGALRTNQRGDGSWDTYWWRTPMYPTATAIDALVRSGDASDGAAVDAGVQWIARSQSDDGSWDGGDGEGGAFVTGLALQTLGPLAPYRSAWSRGVEWLRRRQRSDGAWDPCPILQIPPPWVSDAATVANWKRGGVGAPARIADQHRLFTTSVCYAARNTFSRGAHG